MGERIIAVGLSAQEQASVRRQGVGHAGRRPRTSSGPRLSGETQKQGLPIGLREHRVYGRTRENLTAESQCRLPVTVRASWSWYPAPLAHSGERPSENAIPAETLDVGLRRSPGM